jgi:hypothetical protein
LPNLHETDRVEISRGVSPAWLTNAGHLSVAVAGHLDVTRAAALGSIYLALGSDDMLLAAKRRGSSVRTARTGWFATCGPVLSYQLLRT